MLQEQRKSLWHHPRPKYPRAISYSLALKAPSWQPHHLARKLDRGSTQRADLVTTTHLVLISAELRPRLIGLADAGLFAPELSQEALDFRPTGLIRPPARRHPHFLLTRCSSSSAGELTLTK